MKTHIYPIFIPHVGCPFTCIYCDQRKITHSNNLDWDSTLYNVERFIKKHSGIEKEIAFFGGTFTCLTNDEMMAYCDRLLPLFDSQTFFRISTRPDAINKDILLFLRECRARTIELGVQSFSDVELLACGRGYASETAIIACRLVKEYNFRLSIQLLIGLPSADMVTYNDTLRVLCDLHPDYVRLYPLLVLADTQLGSMFLNGEYQPLELDEAIRICQIFYDKCIENGIKVIKIGLHSDIDKSDVIAGPYHPRFGEFVVDNGNRPANKRP